MLLVTTDTRCKCLTVGIFIEERLEEVASDAKGLQAIVCRKGFLVSFRIQYQSMDCQQEEVSRVRISAPIVILCKIF
jgi:hypothetical protein